MKDFDDVEITEEQYKTAKNNGISRVNVRNRMRLPTEWTIERAISEPVKQKESRYAKWLDLAHQNGISTQAFHSRKKLGWSNKRAATNPIKTDGSTTNVEM